MFFKITSALAITLMMATTAMAQSSARTTNQYLVPNANSRAVQQEVPVISGQTVRSFQTSNTSTRPRIETTNPTIAQPTTTTTTTTPDQVGENYFHGNSGCGCDGGGCGDGGCGCDNYNSCATDCCNDYVRIFGGWNEVEEFGQGAAGAATREYNFRDGWGMGAAFGDYINCNLRREVEFAYRHNSADNITTNGQVSGGLTGNIQAHTTMFNLVYEMNNIDLAGFRPYAGGGIGAAYVDADLASGGATFAISDAAFAYQAFVGVEKQVSCNTRGFIEYRYLGTSDLDLESAGGSTDVQYEANSVFVGFHFTK